MIDYTTFSLAGFIGDDYFGAWVRNPTPDTDLFWQQWLLDHPEKQALVAQARWVLLSVDFHKTPPAEIDAEKILYRIKATLQEDQKPSAVNPQSQGKRTKIPILRRGIYPATKNYLAGWQRIAAVFLGTLVMVAAAYYLTSGFRTDQVYATAYGETKTVLLPDRSEVRLNGNSTLHFPTHWKAGAPREVWLTGEAYFEVQEVVAYQADEAHPEDINSNALVKFVVHTEALDIEVVGTQFNVNTRREKTEVVLNSGKVRLKIEDQAGKEVEMQPGEMVGYSTRSREVVRKVVDPAVYASWNNNHLIFDEVPLQKVAETLEDTYGITVIFEDARLSERVFKGVFPADSVEVLLEALSDIYQVQVFQTERKIIFHHK